MTTYRYTTIVEECSERSAVLSAHKDPDGEVRIERVSIGWWLTLRNDLGGHITWPLGASPPQPPFVPGEKIIITVAKAESAV